MSPPFRRILAYESNVTTDRDAYQTYALLLSVQSFPTKLTSNLESPYPYLIKNDRTFAPRHFRARASIDPVYVKQRRQWKIGKKKMAITPRRGVFIRYFITRWASDPE